MPPGRVRQRRSGGAARRLDVTTEAFVIRGRPAGVGEPEEAGGGSPCCARDSSRSARRCPPSRRRSPSALGARHASAVSSGTAGLHLALRAVGVADGDEVVTSPFSFVASANVDALRARAARVRRHRPAHAQPRPGRGRGRRSRGRTTALLPVHIFGYPADLPALERHGLPIVEDACEALGAVHADGTRSAARGHPAAFGFYANKQLTTGEGGMVTLGSAEHKERIDSERNQGRAPDMGWLDHDRLGFNYRLSDLACALGLAQLERLDDMLAARARVAGWYREALAGLVRERGLALPCQDAGGDVRGWFVFVVQLPDGRDRDATILALRERGVQSKPYLPAIHLMSFYRERFGHREGEFPVCERVAARVARAAVLPGSCATTQVERVAEALAAVLRCRRRAGGRQAAA